MSFLQLRVIREAIGSSTSVAFDNNAMTQSLIVTLFSEPSPENLCSDFSLKKTAKEEKFEVCNSFSAMLVGPEVAKAVCTIVSKNLLYFHSGVQNMHIKYDAKIIRAFAAPAFPNGLKQDIKFHYCNKRV